MATDIPISPLQVGRSDFSISGWEMPPVQKTTDFVNPLLHGKPLLWANVDGEGDICIQGWDLEYLKARLKKVAEAERIDGEQLQTICSLLEQLHRVRETLVFYTLKEPQIKADAEGTIAFEWVSEQAYLAFAVDFDNENSSYHQTAIVLNGSDVTTYERLRNETIERLLKWIEQSNAR